jgi:importin-7
MGCLDDPEIPVRCQAALAMQPLLRHEYVVNAMRPQIGQLMQRLLNLVDEVDADMLSMVMEEFVEQFHNELAPFAVDLALNLVCHCTRSLLIVQSGTCLRLLMENEKELAEDNSIDGVTQKVLSALGIMNTLSTLILSIETKPELLRALEASVLPVLVFVLENRVYGMFFSWSVLNL